jgi:HD superfamily phosphohydrolase
MPKWGLTVEQRKSKPWGLSPELLEPAKTITDPVHSDIYLTNLEISFLDSPPMQRLRRIRQLGTTHLVYPGATHSRFSHSLGTLRSSQDLLDAVLAQRYGPHPVIDLFKEWEASPPEYDKKVAEATVLARLGVENRVL